MIKQRCRIVGTRAGFRVSLEAESRLVGTMNPLQRAIKQGFVCCPQVRGQSRLINSKTVVLAGDHHYTTIQILDRVVPTMMAKFHFDGLGPRGQTEELVA